MIVPMIEDLLTLSPALVDDPRCRSHACPPVEEAGGAGWRAFSRSVLLVDWACYTHSANRVSPAKLDKVLRACPAGVRLWTCPDPRTGNDMPIGYTSFHRISEAMFQRLETVPQSLAHRNEIVAETSDTSLVGAFLYLHNISIIPQFIGTALSARLVKAVVNDFATSDACGLAAVTVSDDGQRVCRRFGLHPTGDIVADGKVETVYVGRWNERRKRK